MRHRALGQGTGPKGHGMMFIDGTNLLVQASKRVGQPNFRADKPTKAALQLCDALLYDAWTEISSKAGVSFLLRRYWMGSYQGDDLFGDRVRDELREHVFEPCMFKRVDSREKGVDIALAKNMLVNAFSGSMSVAVLVAGDSDYVELVEEVKRYGCLVVGVFLEAAWGRDLRLQRACDDFVTVFPDNVPPKVLGEWKAAFGT